MDSDNDDEITANDILFDEDVHDISAENESIGIASPTYSAPASPDAQMNGPGSPMGSNPQSPDNNSIADPCSPVSPHSPVNLGSPGSHSSHSGPASPDCVADAPESPDEPGEANSVTSLGNPESPVGPASPFEYPQGSPLSAGGSNRSRSVSPDKNAAVRSRSNSLASSGNRSRSGSPAGVRSRSGSPAGSQNRSWSASPAGSKSRSVSPAGSGNTSRRGSRSRSVSQTRSGSRSPRNGSPHGSQARSRSGSARGSRSRNVSPTGSRSRSGSARGSQSRSVSPAGSRSRSRSASPPTKSRSRSASSSSAKNRNRSRSRSTSPVRRHSGSPAGIRSPSRSVSPALSRSRSKSPGKSRSRSRSASPALSRSRSRSSAKSRSRSASPARSRSGSRPRSPEGDDEEVVGRRKRRVTEDSDHEASDKGSEVGELIADIFGSSDEEEFEGFGNAEAETQPKKDKKKAAVLSDDDGAGDAASVLPDLSDDDDMKGKSHAGDFVSDFDLMLERKKEEMRKRRKKRKDVDIINDNDDLIDVLIGQMRTAAEDDRALNQQRKPAVKKLGMLPKVISQLKKADLQNAFIDGGILGAMTEWLAPLPDKSLPHLQIREAMLKHLLDFPTISNEGLKTSGIGKAVMYLYKHPKEIRQNKDMAQKLINEWSRPIFNLTSDLKNLSREEREQRDYEHLPKKRRISLETGATPRRDIDNALASDDRALRPGDPGYVYRARVPQPSVKDYVIRPKWNVEEKLKGKVSRGKGSSSRIDKWISTIKEAKKKGFTKHSAMSIEGRNLAL